MPAPPRGRPGARSRSPRTAARDASLSASGSTTGEAQLPAPVPPRRGRRPRALPPRAPDRGNPVRQAVASGPRGHSAAQRAPRVPAQSDRRCRRGVQARSTWYGETRGVPAGNALPRAFAVVRHWRASRFGSRPPHDLVSLPNLIRALSARICCQSSSSCASSALISSTTAGSRPCERVPEGHASLAQLVDLGVDPRDGLHEHVNDSICPDIPSRKRRSRSARGLPGQRRRPKGDATTTAPTPSATQVMISMALVTRSPAPRGSPRRARVVAQLVEHCDPDLLAEVVDVVEVGFEQAAEDRDAVGQVTWRWAPSVSGMPSNTP